jgi:tetratricopeptide (TPR) repeat protein
MVPNRQPNPHAHDRKCALRIRTRRLVEAGDPPKPPLWLLHGIAREIHRCCGHSLLKAHRLAYDWTVEEAVEAFHAMCKERHLGARGLTTRSWTEWESGANPNGDYQDLLCRLFTTGPVQLGFATDYSDEDSGPHREKLVVPALSLEAMSGGQRGHGKGENEGNGTNRRNALKRVGAGVATPVAPKDALAEAAAEALGFTRRAQASAVGPGALEHLELAVTEFNVAWAWTPPAELFDTVRWYRREVDRLIAGPHTLREGRQLYAYAGWLSQLLAVLAFDLGDQTAAEAFGVDAWHHGQEAGHDELCAWAMDVKATIALYYNQPGRALTAALRGAQHVAGRPMAVRLMAKAAHAYAHVGQREDFETTLRDAIGMYERLPAQVPLHFGLDSGQLAAYAVTCYPASACIQLGLADQARRHATDALELLTAAPEKDYSPPREAIARIDLALALIPLGSPDEACGLGDQALSSERVTFAVRTRVLELDAALRRNHADLPEVQQFHERCRLLAPPHPRRGVSQSGPSRSPRFGNRWGCERCSR